MLREGDRAPEFSLQTDRGTTATMADFGGRWLVLYFYPKDSTPGCTREAQGFSAARSRLEALGAVVVGVSRDSVKSHRGFCEKQGLAITLLSDPDLVLHNAYGAYGEKMMYGKTVMWTRRSTFLIDPDGRIARVFPAVKVDGHVDAVLEALVALGAGPARAAAQHREG